jgi:O-antigen/teichoic acid export membrane protein
MDRSTFGAVLAAQALYGVLQFLVDNGAAFHGARLTAAGTLDDPARASIVRVRLQIAGVAATTMVVVGAAGGATLLIASAPYAVALIFWGLLNYWESYGHGDGRPLSSYLVLRGAAPTAVALPFLVGSGAMPAYAAGLAECASLIVVSAYFHMHPLRALASGARAARGPWRKIITVGIPSIAWQIGLASGTVMLAVAHEPEAAAVLGVGVRLLTGLNQLAAVLATALFPALARAGDPLAPEHTREMQAGMIDLAARAVVCLSSLAFAVFLVGSSFFVNLVLHHGGLEAQRTATLTLGTAGVAGISILLSFVLVARHREAIAAVAFGAGAAVLLVLGVAVVVAAPADEALAMAGALAAGQVVGMTVGVRRSLLHVPGSRRSLLLASAAALAMLAGAVLVVAVAEARLPVAAGCVILGCALMLGHLRRVGGFVLARRVVSK